MSSNLALTLGYLNPALNNPTQFFGIVRKGHYLYIFKELTTIMVQQNVWAVLLFNGKVEDVNIYSVILVKRGSRRGLTDRRKTAKNLADNRKN